MNNKDKTDTAVVIPDNQFFSAKRWKRYVRLYLTENGRQLLLLLGVMLIATIIFLIFGIYSSFLSEYAYLSETGMLDSLHDKDLAWNVECQIMAFTIGVFSMIAGTLMFKSFSTKASRHSVLLIPASAFEKFITWLIIYLPLFIIASWACFFIGDLVRVIWTKLFTDYGALAKMIPLSDILSLHAQPFAYSYEIETPFAETFFDITLTYCFLVTIHACYALGSSFFHKMAFLKTSIAGFVISVVLSLTSFFGTKVFFPGDNFVGVNPEEGITTATSIWCMSITFIICTGFYILSYYRMKESEIIDRW